MMSQRDYEIEARLKVEEAEAGASKDRLIKATATILMLADIVNEQRIIIEALTERSNDEKQRVYN